MRRSNYGTFYALLASFILILILSGQKLYVFLKEVYYYRAWKEFFVSTILLILINLGFFILFGAETLIPYIALLVTFISYCIYWHLFFNSNVRDYYNENWIDWNWWWTLDGWEFEEEVAKIFRMLGYKAKVTKKTGDGGVDIILEKNGGRCVVQCKHWQDPVDPQAVHALLGVREDFYADNVLMIASSGISQMGLDFIERHKEIYSYLVLEDIIDLAKQLRE